MKLFISYRRKSWASAHLLALKLRWLLEVIIFIDYEAVDETDFEQSIMTHLRGSDVFLLIVTEYTFAPDRIFRANDWVRREIREALSLNIPIVVAFIDGLMISPDIPDDIQLIRKMQGISILAGFLDEAVEKLANFIVKATPIASRELTEEEERLRALEEQSRIALFTALTALADGDQKKLIDQLLSVINALQKPADDPPVLPAEELERSLPAKPDTLPEEKPADPTLPRLSSETPTESAPLPNPLEWADEATAPPDVNPLEDLMNLLREGKSSSEILDWFYPRPPADSTE